MDKKLLDALDNLAHSLDVIAEVLSSKEESKSETTNALVKGDFTKNIDEISLSVKSIKADTEEILKNQQTILSISKENETNKTKEIEETGSNNNLKENLTKGVSTILLISTAVLAIGAAFNLVGDVDFLSVTALGLSMVAIGYAFAKVAEQTQDMSLQDILITSSAFVAMAAAVVASSYLLSMVQPVGLAQWTSSILIAGVFTVMGYGMGKIINSFEDVSIAQAVTTAITLPLILPAIALGIAGASYGLSLVQPVGLGQWASSILIASVFTVIGFGLKSIINSFDGLSPAEAITASITMPLILPAIALGIAGASYGLSLVQPVNLSQWASSILVASVMVLTSLALKPMINGLKDLDWGMIVKLPVFFTLLSASIMVSSHILNQSVVIDDSKLFSIAALAGIMALTTLVLTPAFMAIEKFGIGIGTLAKGGLAILIIATTVMVASHILNAGNYGDYPDVEWATGVGLSMLAFGVAGVALGMLVFGPQALVFASGMVAILGVASTIVATSHILKNGDYNNPGMLDWAKSTALLFATFTPIMIVLGAVGLASSVMSFFGANPWEKAKEMMVGIADTIVEVSLRLQKGEFKGGPSKEWAEGIGIALGAFSPVYGMLMKNKVLSIFGGSGVGPEDFKKAILIVSDGIIAAAGKFKESTAEFKGGPTKDWAEGVGGSISAFSVVFDTMVSGSGFFKSGREVVGDMVYAVGKIVDSIVDTSNKLKSGDFSTKISSDYLSGLSQGVKEYIKLAKFVEEQGDESDVVEDILDGNNPLSKITEGIDNLAGSYDRLGSSLQKVNSSLAQLNVDKLRDVNAQMMINPDITKVETDNSSLFDKITNKLTPSFSPQINTTVGNIKNNPELKTQFNKDGLSVPEQLDLVIALLSNIDNSTKTIDEYIEEITEGNLEKNMNKD
jgi:hypothetical protein